MNRKCCSPGVDEEEGYEEQKNCGISMNALFMCGNINPPEIHKCFLKFYLKIKVFSFNIFTFGSHFPRDCFQFHCYTHFTQFFVFHENENERQRISLEKKRYPRSPLPVVSYINHICHSAHLKPYVLYNHSYEVKLTSLTFSPSFCSCSAIN